MKTRRIFFHRKKLVYLKSHDQTPFSLLALMTIVSRRDAKPPEALKSFLQCHNPALSNGECQVALPSDGFGMLHICCRTRQEEELDASVMLINSRRPQTTKEPRIDRSPSATKDKRTKAQQQCFSRRERSPGLSSILQKKHELIVTTNKSSRSQRCSDSQGKAKIRSQLSLPVK